MTVKAQILTRLWRRSEEGARRVLERRLKRAGLIHLLEGAGAEDSRPCLSSEPPPLPKRVREWPQDLRDAFEERAALMELDGELPRPESERHSKERVRLEFKGHERAPEGPRNGRVDPGNRNGKDPPQAP